MTEYTIRGGLGNQILELLGCMSDALIKGIKIDKINIASMEGDVEHAHRHWISDVFSLPFAVVHEESRNKFRVWDKLETIFTHPVRPPLKVYPKECQRLIHIRAMDRNPVSKEQYLQVVQPRDIIIGDNIPLCQEIAEITSTRYLQEDVIVEWRYCLGAEVIVGPVSCFTLSAAIYTRKPIKLFRNSLDLSHRALDTIGEYLPNLTWLYDT